MMRKSDAPAARAASTNSFCFNDSTSPRTMRATGIQKKAAMTKMTARMLLSGPMMVFAQSCVAGNWVTMMAEIRNGIARNKSVMRIRALSSHFP